MPDCSLRQAAAIMRGFPDPAGAAAMEAERQNALAEKLADLAARGRELRRYL
jgi:peptide chain release factor 2